MEPITRSEQYLASIIGEDVVLPVPQSRIEHYLNLIAQNGISPSSAGLISYDPDADYPDGSLGAGMKAEAAEVNDLKSAISNGKEKAHVSFEMTNDNRIAISKNTLPAGTTVYISDPLFDIQQATYSSVWNDGSVTLASDDYVRVRLKSKANITSYIDYLATIVYTEVNAGLLNTAFASNGAKYAHFSFDDCVFWTDLFDNKDVYDSIFDNSFLSDLKDLHDEYGAVFTLNCFCTSSSKHIESMTSNFANEFRENKDWLRFAFHAEDSSTHYDTDNVEGITASYNHFTSGIYAMTGDTDCIDRVTRLGYFSGTENNVVAIRDCQCGILGLLTADDTRVSYYLDTANNNYILSHAKMYDSSTKLTLIKSQTRLESVSTLSTWLNYFKNLTYANMAKYVEFFTHEYEWNSTMKGKLESLFAWCKSNGYVFCYMQDVLKL